jgi:hypothetical protein
LIALGFDGLMQSAWQSEWGLTGLPTVALAPVRAQIEAAADAAPLTRIEAAALTEVWASSSVEP